MADDEKKTVPELLNVLKANDEKVRRISREALKPWATPGWYWNDDWWREVRQREALQREAIQREERFMRQISIWGEEWEEEEETRLAREHKVRVQNAFAKFEQIVKICVLAWGDSLTEDYKRTAMLELRTEPEKVKPIAQKNLKVHLISRWQPEEDVPLELADLLEI